MWRMHTQTDPASRHLRVTVGHRSSAAEISFGRALDALAGDPTFRAALEETLRACRFSAFRFECPGVAESALDRRFEFVLVDSPGLQRATADPTPFRAHLDADPRPIVTFENLGRDAVLIVPNRAPGDEGYGHLASFVRTAPVETRHHLWRSVAEAMQARLQTEPRVWLNTAGAGVPWLHVRLDRRPKYYRGGLYEADQFADGAK